MIEVLLRDVFEDDLAIFFEQQQDPEANYMAAYTVKDPSDKAAFDAHWAKILGDETIIKKTVLYEGQVAGQILLFEHMGQPEVSYWIGREYCGKGIATRALSLFIRDIKTRPLYARAVKDHIASIRILGKNGFIIWGEDKGYAHARGEEVEEYIMKLSF
ncbi:MULTISPECIES: GNAT family N-acetyltransferase [Paenibacillus]|uniref:GNAT family N-acetyltransferase n=1 Tax=Paenibacillus lautus TaxID=1401 RepID=A0A1R1AW50_PAELA|nr:GNAT family N-acetyltransferase [Paenibacillus lautus]OME89788.1 GNAT family N-acetyltransferase [Paenibacillus lautus]